MNQSLRKIPIALVAFALFSPICKSEVLSFYMPSDNKTVQVDLEVLAHGDAETAWRVFSTVWWNRYQLNIMDIAHKAGKAIALNPKVQAYAEEKLKPVTSGYQPELEELLYLGGIPAPWSARLLAAHLLNTTPMDPRIMNQGDVGYFENQGLAVEAFTNLGFSDAPTSLDKNGFVQAPPGNLSLEARWQVWWKKNEPIIEQRIREINPGYYPPQPAATATPAPPKPAVAGEYAATPAVSNTPTPAPSVTPVAAAPEKQSDDWAVYIIGGLVAIAALVAVGWAIRRR